MAGDELFADLVPNRRSASKSSNNGSPYGSVQDDPVVAPSYDSQTHRDGKGEPMVCIAHVEARVTRCRVPLKPNHQHDGTQRKDAPSLKDPSASAMDVAVSAALERVMKRVMPRFEEFAEETTRYDTSCNL